MIKAREILELLERQSHRCALTGCELTPSAAALTYRLPLSRGGEHTVGNALIVDQKVALAKASMDEAEFIAMCRAVAAFAGSAEGP